VHLSGIRTDPFSYLMGNEMRYLGLFIVHSRMFRCSLERAKVILSRSECSFCTEWWCSLWKGHFSI